MSKKSVVWKWEDSDEDGNPARAQAPDVPTRSGSLRKYTPADYDEPQPKTPEEAPEAPEVSEILRAPEALKASEIPKTPEAAVIWEIPSKQPQLAAAARKLWALRKHLPNPFTRGQWWALGIGSVAIIAGRHHFHGPAYWCSVAYTIVIAGLVAKILAMTAQREVFSAKTVLREYWLDERHSRLRKSKKELENRYRELLLKQGTDLSPQKKA